ncbi:DNA-packaging protein [Erythrobacter sp. NFXS35]
MIEPLAWYSTAPPEARKRLVHHLSQREKNQFRFQWPVFARPEQLAPTGEWRIWMIMAGRGFGKTRTGAEWVRMVADCHPAARIALVSSSLAEARSVMVEGESGLMAIYPPDERPHFEPSLHRIRFASGAQAQLFSAAEPDSLRGPQHSHACRPSTEGIFCKSGLFHLGRAFTTCGRRLVERAPGKRVGW